MSTDSAAGHDDLLKEVRGALDLMNPETNILLSQRLPTMITDAGRETLAIQHRFTPHGGDVPAKTAALFNQAVEIVGQLKTDEDLSPDDTIKKLVELSAFPRTKIEDLSKDFNLAEARIDSAKRVADLIERSLALQKFEGKPADTYYLKDKPATNDDEKTTRVLALAAIMRSSMAFGFGEGEGLAKKHQDKDPQNMGTRYAPAALTAYGEAIRISQAVSQLKEKHEEDSTKIDQAVYNLVRYEILEK